MNTFNEEDFMIDFDSEIEELVDRIARTEAPEIDIESLLTASEEPEEVIGLADLASLQGESNRVSETVYTRRWVGESGEDGYYLNYEVASHEDTEGIEECIGWVENVVGRRDARIILYKILTLDQQQSVAMHRGVTLTREDIIRIIARIEEAQINNIFGEDSLIDEYADELDRGWEDCIRGNVGVREVEVEQEDGQGTSLESEESSGLTIPELDEFDWDSLLEESVEQEVTYNIQQETANEAPFNYVYTIEMENESGIHEEALRGNISWLQDRLSPTGAYEFVYNNLPEDRQQYIRENRHIMLNATECVFLNYTIVWLQRGVRAGLPMLEQLDIVRDSGWGGLEDRVMRAEQGELEEPVEATSQEPVTPVAPRRQRTPRVVNDYTLAWEIYSLGYSTAEIANMYKSSAGSISRGMKKDGHTMRTGAETKAMSKTRVDNFSNELIGRITELISTKYETEEEKNGAFYRTFNTNLYELTLYEAEDEEAVLENMQERATTQGVSLRDLARQQLQEQAYEERECSLFVRKVRNLHQQVKDSARVFFGDVNVGVGAVEVQTKLRYENGIVLTVNDAYKIDGKALDATSVTMTVKISEYVARGFEREVEQLSRQFNNLVGEDFMKDGQRVSITQLGNRMVVGLDNE